MQGLRSTETHPVRAISAREQSGLALRQKRLLESAVLATRPGGQIVYSTCTLSPEEDEGVIDGVLKRFGSTLQLDDISSAMPEDARGILQDKDVTYSEEVRKAARLWPHIYGTAGFFAARFTRLDAPAHSTTRENMWGRQNRYELLPHKQLAGLIQQWQDQYSFRWKRSSKNTSWWLSNLEETCMQCRTGFLAGALSFHSPAPGCRWQN